MVPLDGRRLSGPEPAGCIGEEMNLNPHWSLNPG